MKRRPERKGRADNAGGAAVGYGSSDKRRRLGLQVVAPNDMQTHILMAQGLVTQAIDNVETWISRRQTEGALTDRHAGLLHFYGCSYLKAAHEELQLAQSAAAQHA